MNDVLIATDVMEIGTLNSMDRFMKICNYQAHNFNTYILITTRGNFVISSSRIGFMYIYVVVLYFFSTF